MFLAKYTYHAPTYLPNILISGTYLNQKIKNVSPGPVPEVKKICIDQRLGKYYCTLRKFKQSEVLANSCGLIQKQLGRLRDRPRKILQFLLSLKPGNRISST